jgi:hypothetical protein
MGGDLWIERNLSERFQTGLLERRHFDAAVLQRLAQPTRDIDGAGGIAVNADGVDVRAVPSASPGFRYPREPVTSLQAGEFLPPRIEHVQK